MQSQHDTRICNYCQTQIPKLNFRVHSFRCRLKKQKQKKIQILQQQQKDQAKIKKEKRIPFDKQRFNNSAQRFNNSAQRQNNSAQIIKDQTQQQRIPCTYCGYLQTFMDLDTHPKECIGQYQICLFCNEKYPRQIMEEHTNVCQKRPIFQSDQQLQVEERQQQSEPLSFQRIVDMLQALSALMGQGGFEQQQNGLSKKQLKQLKRIKYELIKQAEMCTICYCQFQQKEQIIELKCKHLYHSECIQKWLQRNSRCPNCKRDQHLE